MKVTKPSPTVVEVDIHGLMASDAKARLEHLLSHVDPQVREVVVIHGYSRGTVLRDMVRTQLKHPRIQTKLLSLNQGQTRILLKEPKAAATGKHKAPPRRKY